MKTLSELLHYADPLRDEPAWSADDRRRLRQAIISRSTVPTEVPSRRSANRAFAFAAVGVVATVLIVLSGLRLWDGSTGVQAAAVRFEMRLAEEAPAPGLREAVVAHSTRKVYLHDGVVVSNIDIVNAVISPANGSVFGVIVTLRANAAERMRRATGAHIGRPVAILIDGEVVTAPIIRDVVGETAVISGGYTKAEADRIATGILGR